MMEPQVAEWTRWRFIVWRDVVGFYGLFRLLRPSSSANLIVLWRWRRYEPVRLCVDDISQRRDHQCRGSDLLPVRSFFDGYETAQDPIGRDIVARSDLQTEISH